MKNFLISFCNNKKKIISNLNLIAELKVNLESEQATIREMALDLPGGLAGNGITGVCFHKNMTVLLLQRMPSTLVFLNSDLTFNKSVELKGLVGVHSILSHENEIYLSVTNQDRIVKITDNGEQKEVWTKGTLNDSIHLNSLCIHKGELCASAFGRKSNQLWSSAQSGYVFNVKTNEKILENVWHPHSTFDFQEQIYCCDSSNQRIINENGIVQSDLPGYTRGLYIDEDVIVCGNSQGRQVSHSTGVKITNQSGQGVKAGTCCLTVLFKKNQKTIHLDLTTMATEVFDIRPLQNTI